jgi:hypothetical protein
MRPIRMVHSQFRGQVLLPSAEGNVMLSNKARLLGLICELWGSLESSLYRRKRQVADLSPMVRIRLLFNNRKGRI